MRILPVNDDSYLLKTVSELSTVKLARFFQWEMSSVKLPVDMDNPWITYFKWCTHVQFTVIQFSLRALNETSWDKDEPKGDEEMSAPDIGHDIKGTDRQMEWHLKLLTKPKISKYILKHTIIVIPFIKLCTILYI